MLSADAVIGNGTPVDKLLIPSFATYVDIGRRTVRFVRPANSPQVTVTRECCWWTN